MPAWQKEPDGRQRWSLSSLWAALRRLMLRPDAVLWLLLGSLFLMPVVIFQAISSATVAKMEMHADEISTLATGIRAYYADNVIARLQASGGKAMFSDNYRDVHGGIPIPATLSIELGALFDNAHADGRITYEFISDYPFAKRPSRPLNSFQREAIDAFREDPLLTKFTRLQGNGLGRSSYQLATPILMRKACVTCHRTHPDSPKRDWKEGDVRGIQEITVRGLRLEGFDRIGYLLAYAGLLSVTSVAAAGVFRQQSTKLAKLNRQLVDANQRESTLAARMEDQLQELSIFGSVVDHSIVGIAIADMRQPDAPLIYVNTAFTMITGYPKALAVGYNCRFLQGPDTDPTEVQRIREALQAGNSYTGELINYRQDGTSFWNRLTLYPVMGGSSGKPDFYVGNQVDISRLKLQAAVPFQQLNRVGSELIDAQETLMEANRFSQALWDQIQQSGPSASMQMEAFLRSEQQAHQKLSKTLQSMAQAIRSNPDS